MDATQEEVLRLSAQEASRIPPKLRPSGLSKSSGGRHDLPLHQGLYHWTLQWQKDAGLREKVGCVPYTAIAVTQADLALDAF